MVSRQNKHEARAVLKKWLLHQYMLNCFIGLTEVSKCEFIMSEVIGF